MARIVPSVWVKGAKAFSIRARSASGWGFSVGQLPSGSPAGNMRSFSSVIFVIILPNMGDYGLKSRQKYAKNSLKNL